MYAIITAGGKQYKVEKDLKLNVEKLDANVGDKVKFDLLFISDEGKVTNGNPIKNAYAEAEVLAQEKDKKIIVFKKKKKKNERKRQGHRQPFTTVKILSIVQG